MNAVAHPATPAGATLGDLAYQAMPIEPKSVLTVGIEDHPMPPAELVEALDNSDLAAADDEDEGETVILDFVGDDLPEEVFTLRHPFMWDGRRVDTVTVRQLNTTEVARLARKLAGKGEWDLFELYALMTGLPAKVLRSLPSVDGQPITGRAWDFLPPYLR